MSEFLTADEMRTLEAAAIESGKVTGLELMERAGEGVIAAIEATWPEREQPCKAVVLCGPGNNGGDGFVVARLLLKRGWGVTLFFYGDAARLPPDARHNHDRWIGCEAGRTLPLTFPQVTQAEAVRFAREAYEGSPADVVVDALFGIGLARPLDGLRPVLKRHKEYCATADGGMSVRHVSIDVPSGLAEQGPIETRDASVFHADLTVTFHCRKLAHRNGAAWCGQIVVKDIGL